MLFEKCKSGLLHVIWGAKLLNVPHLSFIWWNLLSFEIWMNHDSGTFEEKKSEKKIKHTWTRQSIQGGHDGHGNKSKAEQKDTYLYR